MQQDSSWPKGAPQPQTLDEANRLIAELHHKLATLELQEKQLKDEVSELKQQLEYVLEQLSLNQSKRFGQSSEKEPKGTFNEAEQEETLEAEPQEKPETESPKKGRQPLPDHLEREEREYRLDEPQCECCGEAMHECGSEITEQLKIIPAKISVIRHKCTKYACRNCEQTAESNRVVTAPKPKQPIPQSIASPEALAAITTAKYCDALPLYRQSEILARGGLEISRGTLANWCIKGGELLKPLWLAMKTHLLSGSLVCADETPIQVLDEPGRKATSKSYMWVYRCGEFSEQPVVLYDYRPGRGQTHPQSFLDGYEGLLLCDGYKAYETLEDVLLAGCWTHVRRKFKDAEKAQPKKAGRVQVALSYISKLYRIEKSVKSATAEQRQAVRQEKSLPLLAAFKSWLDKAVKEVLPKSLLGKAISYTLNQWSKLQTYLSHGDVSIDNNVTERDIRPFTTGRKNWLFSQSVNGAEASGILYSLVMTCRANDINPYFYFKKLFTELPNREPGCDLTDLMPWNVTLDTS